MHRTNQKLIRYVYLSVKSCFVKEQEALPQKAMYGFHSNHFE